LRKDIRNCLGKENQKKVNDEDYMQQALREAQKAFDSGEVPVGAILVLNEKVIARTHNQVQLLNDSTAHSEILALTTAFNFLGSKYLPDATLYVTLEPCLMCSGALYWSKIGRVVYGAEDKKNGYRKTTGENNPFHPRTKLAGGVLKKECAALMKDFFREKR
jgi:tRNA(adenine34) deaminase